MSSSGEGKFDATDFAQDNHCEAKQFVTASRPYFHVSHAAEPFNPTVLPRQALNSFHFTFLIRHPRFSIPSLYKISTPPVSNITGWHGFHPQDAGYIELRQLFDYLREMNQIGPVIAGHERVTAGKGGSDDQNSGLTEICLIDAEDLLKTPGSICKVYCNSVGHQFHPSMLRWDTLQDHERAEHAFQKSLPEHKVALSSTSIIPPRNVGILFKHSVRISHSLKPD